jgi:hypothetical protein
VVTERGLEGDVVIYPASRIAEYHNVDQQAQVLLEVISGELKQFSVSFYRIEVEDDKEAYFAPVEISVCHKGHLDVDNFVKVEYSDTKHGMFGTNTHANNLFSFSFMAYKKKDIKSSHIRWLLLEQLRKRFGISPDKKVEVTLHKYTKGTVGKIEKFHGTMEEKGKAPVEGNKAEQQQQKHSEANNEVQPMQQDDSDALVSYNEKGEVILKEVNPVHEDLSRFMFGDNETDDREFRVLKSKLTAEQFSKLEATMTERMNNFVELLKTYNTAEENSSILPDIIQLRDAMTGIGCAKMKDEQSASAVLQFACTLVKNEHATIEKMRKDKVASNGTKSVFSFKTSGKRIVEDVAEIEESAPVQAQQYQQQNLSPAQQAVQRFLMKQGQPAQQQQQQFSAPPPQQQQRQTQSFSKRAASTEVILNQKFSDSVAPRLFRTDDVAKQIRWEKAPIIS